MLNSIFYALQAIEMKVDNCGISACMSLTAPQGPNGFLNVNSPLQIGGTLTNLAKMASQLGWDYVPTDRGFVGCIRNMTFNGNVTPRRFYFMNSLILFSLPVVERFLRLRKQRDRTVIDKREHSRVNCTIKSFSRVESKQ